MSSSIDPKDLQQLGLTEREAKVYVALVNHGPTRARQLPVISAIPHGKIYDIVHRLQNRGLLTVCTINQKKHLEAVRPDDAVRALLMEREQEHEVAEKLGRRLEEQLMSVFNEVRGTPSAQSYFTFLLNPAQILRTLKDLHQKSQKDSMWFVKAPYVMKFETPLADEMQVAAMRRGVRLRGIYEGEELPHNADLITKHIIPNLEAGEEARMYPRLKIKLGVIDHQITLFQFVDKYRPEHRTAVVIDNEGVAHSFAACFEYYWERSIPLADFLKTLPAGEESERVHNGSGSSEG